MERKNSLPIKVPEPETESLSKVAETKALLKLDCTIIPILIMLYFLSSLVSPFLCWQRRT